MVVLILGGLAFSHCGGAWSLDRLLFRRRRGEKALGIQQVSSSKYTWPVRLVQVVMVLAFFGAGFSKLSYSGWGWIASDNRALMLVAHHYSHYPLNFWGLHLAPYGFLCQLMAAGTVVFEAGAPLALLSRRLCRVLVPGLVQMQVGIWILLGLGFYNYFLCYLFWVPWNRLGSWVSRRLPGTRIGSSPIEKRNKEWTRSAR